MTRPLVELLNELNERYLSLESALAEARARAREKGALGSDWGALTKRLDDLRDEIERLDGEVGDAIASLSRARGVDARLSDLVSPDEAEVVRAAAERLRETAGRVAARAEDDARVFAERISVIESTLKIFQEAAQSGAYDPRGKKVPPGRTGMFEGEA